MLVWLLGALQRKPAPLFVLDTHAGAGRYELGRASRAHRRVAAGDRPIAGRSAAGAGGLCRPGAIAWPYPGSPTIRALCCGPTTAWPAANCIPRMLPLLRRNFVGDRQVAVHHRDAWEALGALLPPQERRGLMLVDPPFEDPHEFAATRRRPRHRLAALPHRRVRRLVSDQAARSGAPIPDRTAQSGMRDIVTAELCLREPVDPARLNGCGMLVVNPPYRFEQEMPAILAALLDRLGDREPGEAATITRIADE